jgi:hypothetical protein
MTKVPGASAAPPTGDDPIPKAGPPRACVGSQNRQSEYCPDYNRTFLAEARGALQSPGAAAVNSVRVFIGQVRIGSQSRQSEQAVRIGSQSRQSEQTVRAGSQSRQSKQAVRAGTQSRQSEQTVSAGSQNRQSE